MPTDAAADRKVSPSLRILLVTEASGGGVGRHLIDLAGGLVSAGNEVHLVYSPQRADAQFLSELEGLAGLRHTAVKMRRSPHISDVSALVRLRRYLRHYGPFDIVHAHSSKAGMLARIAPLGMRTTRIYTPHALKTMDPHLPWPLRRLYSLVEQLLARSFSAHIIAVSEAERRHAIECRFPGEKLAVIPNGIAGTAISAECRRSFNRTPTQTDRFTLGFVGRLTPQKRPEWTIHALAALKLKYSGLRLVMVADGPLYGDVIQLAKRLGVERDIAWRPDIPGRQAMADMDLLLVPSLYEGFPYVILEAMAEGLPLVITDCAAPLELTNPPTPLRLAPNALHDFIEVVGRLISDPEAQNTLVRTGRTRIKDYSVNRMIARTLDVYSYEPQAADAPVSAPSRRIRPDVKANL